MNNYQTSGFFGPQNNNGGFFGPQIKNRDFFGPQINNGGFLHQEEDYSYDQETWTLYNMDSCSVVRMDHSYINPSLYSTLVNRAPCSENVLNDSGYESSSNENSTSTNLQQPQNLGVLVADAWLPRPGLFLESTSSRPVFIFFDIVYLHSERLLELELRLVNYLCTLDYSNSGIKYISNPLDHAIIPHQRFLDKYLDGEKSVLFLGMNPGPWGMCQTGVPFGDVYSCREFLNIEGPMKTPKLPQHPKRPVEGFECKRKEVSGSRFWGYFQKICGHPEKFFKHCFVLNHCPLAFMKESGKNVAPAEMCKEVRNPLTKACDQTLKQILDLLGTVFIVGVGKFAETRAKSIIKEHGLKIGVGSLMHPSPINPAANKGWDEVAEKALTNMELMPYLKS